MKQLQIVVKMDLCHFKNSAMLQDLCLLLKKLGLHVSHETCVRTVPHVTCIRTIMYFVILETWKR